MLFLIRPRYRVFRSFFLVDPEQIRTPADEDTTRSPHEDGGVGPTLDSSSTIDIQQTSENSRCASVLLFAASPVESPILDVVREPVARALRSSMMPVLTSPRKSKSGVASINRSFSANGCCFHEFPQASTTATEKPS